MEEYIRSLSLTLSVTFCLDALYVSMHLIVGSPTGLLCQFLRNILLPRKFPELRGTRYSLPSYLLSLFILSNSWDSLTTE